MHARNEIIAVMKELGPKTGMPTYQGLFPDIPWGVLWDLLSRYRELDALKSSRLARSLQWTRAGAVWAMDHSDPPLPVDGRYAHLFADRDLAASYQLDWLPMEAETAKMTIDALEARFVEHGPPLVIKCDNKSLLKATREYLKEKWGVFLLLSPVRMPRYNGACEAGIGSMKTRTRTSTGSGRPEPAEGRHQAALHGRPGNWTPRAEPRGETCDDCEAARAQANETARPWGANGPTPDEVWKNRKPITREEHEAFAREVRQYERKLLEGKEVSGKEREKIRRRALAVRRAHGAPVSCPCAIRRTEKRGLRQGALSLSRGTHVLCSQGYLKVRSSISLRAGGASADKGRRSRLDHRGGRRVYPPITCRKLAKFSTQAHETAG